MDAYTVTNADGAILGEFTASEILRGFETNDDIVPGTSWEEVLIVARTGSSVSLYQFLRFAYPELFAGISAQPDEPEPDIDAEVEDIENTPTDKIDAFRKLKFEWMEDIAGISVNDCDGEQMELLDFDQVRNLMRRGVLCSDQEVVVFRVKEWAGDADDRYADEYWPGDYGTLGDVLDEFESTHPQPQPPPPPPTVPAFPDAQTLHRIRTAIQQLRAARYPSALDSPTAREQVIQQLERERDEL
jgi:hypothetical protein